MYYEKLNEGGFYEAKSTVTRVDADDPSAKKIFKEFFSK